MQLANCWKQTNKQTIDSNAISKIFNRKRLTGQSFSKMKKAAGIVKMEYFSRIYHMLDTWHSFFQLCVVGVTISWLGVGGYGTFWPLFCWMWECVTYFLAGCGRLWVGMTFFDWVWVSVSECDFFLVGCR